MIAVDLSRYDDVERVVFLAVVPRGNLPSLPRKDDVRPVADVIAGLNVDAARCVACRGELLGGICGTCGVREGGAT